ncbi:MAG: phosphoglycerate kinase [Phycisphaerales bacterium]|nr:phosphoglycerate kinase [Phycisphaerales bacterium]
MNKKTIESVDVKDKRVLMRADFNVPLDDDLKITDDRRIQSAMPTIRKILDGGGRLILMSHLGRPKNKPEDKYSLAPVAKRLGEILGKNVPLAPDCVGDAAGALSEGVKSGECLLLENLRFHSAETIKDKEAKQDAEKRAVKDEFACSLADMADVYVNDAFGTCHRDNASMLTVPKMMKGKPKVIGYLVQKELEFLGSSLADPKRPFVAVLGGAKVSDKIGVIDALLPKCDHVLIGGAMMYTFFAAQGIPTGKSLVEPDFIEQAKRLMEIGGDKLVLPTDSVVAAEISGEAEHQTVTGNIPDDLMGLDIGPASIAAFANVIKGAKTVIWNGPMGVFETPPFDRGTMAIAQAMADATANGAITIIGGGDSAAAIDHAGLAEKMSHISTGGGASLEFLEGKPFVALEVIDDA